VRQHSYQCDVDLICCLMGNTQVAVTHKSVTDGIHQEKMNHIGHSLPHGEISEILKGNDMERQPVSSSNLATVGYDVATETLEIEFQNGSTYQYYGVPESIFHDLLSAGSVGSYFSRNVKNIYPCHQI
jgi:hypothetical protein